MTADAFRPHNMLRPDIAALQPYTPILPISVLSQRLGLSPEQIIKLDANENPYGPAPAVVEALAEYGHYHIYPDPEQRELRQVLAEGLNVPASLIMATHGADEMLDYLCRLFIEPGDAIVNCPPTFGMYRFDAVINGGIVKDVWRDDRFCVDVDAIEALVNRHATDGAVRTEAGPIKLIFLACPNNPSGNWLPDDQLRRMLDLPALVVVDEAYVEFSNHESRATWVEKHDNLVIVRTFSKVAGMAGLRLGYAVCPEWLMEQLWKFKQPYNVNIAATVAGLASLRSANEIGRTCARIQTERDRLFSELESVEYLEPWPSEANFILCRVRGRSASEIKGLLERQGVMVRHYSSSRLDDCIRISVGRPEHTDRLMEVLGQIS